MFHQLLFKGKQYLQSEVNNDIIARPLITKLIECQSNR